jgi:hypothetical protein
MVTKTQFQTRNPIRPIEEGELVALDRVRNVMNGTSSKEVIAIIDGRFSPDALDRPLIFTRQVFEKITRDHGDITAENLVINGTDWDIGINGTDGHKKLALVKAVPNG